MNMFLKRINEIDTQISEWQKIIDNRSTQLQNALKGEVCLTLKEAQKINSEGREALDKKIKLELEKNAWDNYKDYFND